MNNSTILTTSPYSESVAHDALRRWGREPVPLPRPVVLLTGWGMPRHMLDAYRFALERLTVGWEGHIHRRAIHLLSTIPHLGSDLAEAIEDDEPNASSVDVIAQSMGGIVAREAARAFRSTRLRIHRLYTLASPHAGGRPIVRCVCDPKAWALSQTSSYLCELNADASSHDFPIMTLRLRRDFFVPRHSAHAVGTRHYDLDCMRAWHPPHTWSQWDVRLMAIILGDLLGHAA
jgi:pimeloyl-ACP methyl ester carboxylesterase